MAISFPLVSRGLKVSGKSRTPGTVINYRGLRIYFAGDTERLYARQLMEGRLRFVAFPDHLELHLIEAQGTKRILGRVELGPAGLLLRGGRPIADVRGPIKCLTGHHNARYVSADLLFPEFGKVRLTNRFIEQNSSAFVIYKNMEIKLPIDKDNHWGEAAREGRIVVVANPQKIEFFGKTREGREERIGAINIDSEGYLIGPNGRYHKNGAPVNLHSQRNSRLKISAAELLENFRLRDIPVRFAGGRKRASVEYNWVRFVFNGGTGNAFLNDIAEGAVFLRVGYQDRLEIIGKRTERVEVLGTIRIDKDGFLLEAGGARYCPSKGPVRLGEFRVVNVERLVRALKPEAKSDPLVEKYLPLVRILAGCYRGQGAGDDELISAGQEGLRRASEKYDALRGVPFPVYARYWIKAKMQAAVLKNKRQIWGGEERAKLIQLIGREEGRFYQDQGDWPSDQQLAERTGLSEERIARLRRSAASRVISLQEPKNEEGDLFQQDCVPDDSVITPEEEAIRNETRERISAALSSLSPREQYVIKAHHGWPDDEDLPLERIGEILGEAERGEALSRERIRQIEEKALGRVRENFPALASYL